MSLGLPFAVFGQLVVGAPGAGKSTFCSAVKQFLQALSRPCFVINLDPGNEFCAANDGEPAIDVRDLISLEDVLDSDEYRLGPNGGLLFCVDYMAKNHAWLRRRLLQTIADEVRSRAQQDAAPEREESEEELVEVAKNWDGLEPYFIFDCPGQVELFTNHSAMKELVQRFQYSWQMRLCSVHLVDVHQCGASDRFISVLLQALTTMLHLELPHVNVITKIDLLDKLGPLPLGLDFYTEVLDLTHLLEVMDAQYDRRFHKLNAALCELVEDFSLVSFLPLNITDKHSMFKLIKRIDRSMGYKLDD